MADALQPARRSPDALDVLEERVLAVLRAEPGATWEAARAALAQAEQSGDLKELAPPIDPAEARRSTRELRALIEAIEGRSEPPSERTRVGY